MHAHHPHMSKPTKTSQNANSLKAQPTMAVPSFKSAGQIMQLQKMIGNRAVAQLMSSGKTVIQRMTVTYPTTGMDDYEDILGQARTFHASRGTGVLYDTVNDVQDGDAEGDTHVDVFAHGNQGQVGDFESPSNLRDDLNRLSNEVGMEEIHSVTLHSCESGSEHPRTHEKYGNSLHEKFRDNFAYVDVHGFEGETVTDHRGDSRILKHDKTIEEYKIAARTAIDISTLEDEYLEPVDTGKITFGDSTLGMYSKDPLELGIYDPKEARNYQVSETRKQLAYIKEQMDDEASGADDREVFQGR